MTLGHYLIVVLFVFTLGASIGSFLNVCIYRLPRRQSLVRPKSRCPRCLVPIRPRDNLPVLGWMVLRGRCRSCSLPISARYPAVEAIVGILFVAAAFAEIQGAPVERPLFLSVTLVASYWLLAALLVMSGFIVFDIGRAGWVSRLPLAPHHESASR